MVTFKIDNLATNICVTDLGAGAVPILAVLTIHVSRGHVIYGHVAILRSPVSHFGVSRSVRSHSWPSSTVIHRLFSTLSLGT